MSDRDVVGALGVEVPSRAGTPLPAPLSPFVGRATERAALATAVRTHRLVTATGPGGVGKTRLGLAVAHDLASEVTGGVVFVDLVAVTDDAMVGAAVADAAGVPERVGVGRLDALVAALADRPVLLMVDNCEHVLAGARACVAALVARCPAVRVLATSRIRLLLAGETVYPVPGLSLEADDDGPGDAVALFASRLVAGGGRGDLTPDDEAGVRDLCRRLDGMALAIELAAARAPSLGLDGLRLALGAGHDVLAFAHHHDERHGSLRAAIDWSYELLSDDERAVLRCTAAFASTFELTAAAEIAALDPSEVLAVLGRLVDWNLVGLRHGASTRYRVLETIRQYAAERAGETDELDAIHRRHAAWCDRSLAELARRAPGDDRWCAEVDLLVDDARAALRRAATEGRRGEASVLADRLADVVFLRGWPGEAQDRYEQAASLADDAKARHDALFRAARAALTRYLGDETVRLLRQAADESDAAGDSERAALDLVHLAVIVHRHDGTLASLEPKAQTDAVLARARGLAPGSLAVAVGIEVAQASRNDRDRRPDLAASAVAAARGLGDPHLLDAALDQLCAARLEAGDLDGAAAVVAERLRVMASQPIDVINGMDHADVHLMAAHVDLAAGRFRSGRAHADALAALPFLRGEPHVGLARRVEIDVLAGEFDDAAATAARFLGGWREAGRPVVNNFGPAAYAVAMLHRMRGDDAACADWVEVARAVLRDPASIDDIGLVWPAVLAALADLHTGEPDAARTRLSFAPDELPAGVPWHQHLWLPWYAGAWAEALALTDPAGAVPRLAAARVGARGNDVALLVVDRAERLAAGGAPDPAAMAARFEQLGCPYQADRTRRLCGAAAPAASSPAGLSPRERDVLRLVADGLSNPQIAAELYISRKTAEHHVSNILTKLGAATRAEAAAHAVRLGLADGAVRNR